MRDATHVFLGVASDVCGLGLSICRGVYRCACVCGVLPATHTAVPNTELGNLTLRSLSLPVGGVVGWLGVGELMTTADIFALWCQWREDRFLSNVLICVLTKYANAASDSFQRARGRRGGVVRVSILNCLHERVIGLFIAPSVAFGPSFCPL